MENVFLLKNKKSQLLFILSFECSLLLLSDCIPSFCCPPCSMFLPVSLQNSSMVCCTRMDGSSGHYLSLMSNHSRMTGSLGVRLLTGLSYCLVTVLNSSDIYNSITDSPGHLPRSGYWHINTLLLRYRATHWRGNYSLDRSSMSHNMPMSISTIPH